MSTREPMDKEIASLPEDLQPKVYDWRFCHYVADLKPIIASGWIRVRSDVWDTAFQGFLHLACLILPLREISG